MKYFKRFIAICAVITIFVTGWITLRYLLIDDTSSYTRTMMHEFYEQDNIDVLFMGASHCYRGFNPAVLDERLGVNTYNLGSSSQGLETTYLLMQEAISIYDIDHIYLDISFNMTKYTSIDHNDLQSVYLITDYLKPSLRKTLFLINGSGSQFYANSFLIARRNWNSLFEEGYVSNVLSKKSMESYFNYGYDYLKNEKEYYSGKGYVAGETIIPDGSYFSDQGYDSLNLKEIKEDWIDILQRIIKYCYKHDVKLTLLSIPVSTYLSAGMGNYDEYIEFVNELVEDSGVDYIDFNLLKEEYWADTSTNFKDDNHLNKYGADKFSNLIADYINGDVSPEELLYESMSKKLSSLIPSVYGICYKDSVEENIKKCKVVANLSEEIEYKIFVTPEEQEQSLIQDFDQNNIFEIPMDQHGVIRVEYRLVNRSDEIKSIEVIY